MQIWKTDPSYFKIYPLNQHFIEASDSKIVQKLEMAVCEWLRMQELNLCCNHILKHVLLKKKKHQCVQGLCWKITILQGNKWATLTVVMTCHLMFIIQHYYDHSYSYLDNSQCNWFLTHVLTCTCFSFKCGNSGVAQLLFSTLLLLPAIQTGSTETNKIVQYNEQQNKL